jgi:type VI secretion system protein VasG
LKPALARGELRTIAATTWSEYKKYFEKDPALARRFQVVKVEEPEEAQCMMLRGIVPPRSRSTTRSAFWTKASRRRCGSPTAIWRGGSCPIKPSACWIRLARAWRWGRTPRLRPSRTPRGRSTTSTRRSACSRAKSAAGADHAERLAEIREKRAQVAATLAALKERFAKESALVSRVREIRGQLEEGTGEQEPLRAELEKLNAELAALQGETPMMRVCVDGQIVGEVISAWTGIPTGKMVKDEVQTVLKLEGHLGGRVIGQNHALEGIAQRIRTSRAGLEDPKKPIGVFLLVGPSGVGKTETALALADLMYGGERNLITINMSEFQEAHTVSTLKGSPPGYVGYGEGGVLTEAVRRHPYSVVLLDEVEKAHPDVLEIFFQVFDKGSMEDGEGREIDFKNTIILLTSNAATDTMMKLCADPETMPTPEGIVKAIKPELNKIFKPAFLGRLVVIPYYPVRDEA